jgi:tetratricopeptide (TPR) repeat protein
LSRRAPGAALALALALAGARAGASDTITLTNGRTIEADRAWYEGDQLRYEKNGGVFGIPRSLVQSLSKGYAPEADADPDLALARERIAAGDPVEAIRLLRLSLGRDPRSLPALHALVEAYLKLGDMRAARDTAERAVRLDDNDARSRALLGDTLVALGDREGAEVQYRRSLLLRADPEVQRKLGDVSAAPARPGKGAQFRIRYDGGVNEPLGTAVLETLTEAYAEYSKRLAFHPDDPVTVVLQMSTAFQQDARTPEWAEGVNDGIIRVPVLGLDRPSPRLVQVLRHELAHSFIAARTGGNCPTWLQEGVSQWLEGGDPARDDALVARAAREGRLLPLLTLEGPFQSLAPMELSLAYQESLSAVAHVLRKRGEAGIVRLLSALSDRLPSEEALPVALALSYPEFQKSWEQHLTGTVSGSH